MALRVGVIGSRRSPSAACTGAGAGLGAAGLAASALGAGLASAGAAAPEAKALTSAKVVCP